MRYLVITCFSVAAFMLVLGMAIRHLGKAETEANLYRMSIAWTALGVALFYLSKD